MEHNYFSVEPIKPKTTFQCVLCKNKKSYTFKNNLSRHNRKVHGQLRETNIKCLEEDCTFSAPFSTVSSLRKHLKESHGFNQMIEEIMKFSSFAEFHAWKTKTEANLHVRFICYSIKRKEGRRHMTCHRSGVYKPGTLLRKRSLKLQGSKKCGNICTAGIMTVEDRDSGEITAKICLAHYGHDVELRHIGLSKAMRKKIRGQMLQDVALDKLELVRNKQSERLITTRSGKSSNKMASIKHRHKCSEALSSESLTSLKTSFIYRSNKDYIITKNELDAGHKCKLVCKTCRSCIHEYFCTCVDSSINAEMCKHIHLVCRFNSCHVAVTQKRNEDDHFDHLSSLPPKSDGSLAIRKQQVISALQEVIAKTEKQTNMDVLELALLHVMAVARTLDTSFRNPDILEEGEIR